MRLHTLLHNTPLPLSALVTTFTAIIVTRLTMESWINRFSPRSGTFYLTETLHTMLFFATLFVICVLLIRVATRHRARTAAIVLLCGFLLTIFPPILDAGIAHWFYDGVPFWSYALFDSTAGLWKSFWTFFGNSPTSGITYGTRIMIACAIAGIGGYVLYATRTLWRALAAMGVLYIICFVMSALPSFLTMLLHDTYLHTAAADVAGFIASPTTILATPITDITAAGNTKMSLVYAVLFPLLALTAWCIVRPAQCHSLLRNIRPVQTLYHTGLLAVGMVLAWYFAGATVLWNPFSVLAVMIAFCAVVAAWYATVVFNDIVDIGIDRISNTHRPLVTDAITLSDYRTLGVVLTIGSCAYLALLVPHAALILVGYHALSYLYNTPPLRLKRFPLVATFLAAIASFLIVAIGFILLSPDHSLHHFPWRIGLLLIIAYTISLPIKDLKDIRGDKKYRIATIPVIFGAHVGRVIIGSGILLSFLLSIFLLNIRALFFPALLLGSVAFWCVTARRTNTAHRFTPHTVLWLVFGCVALYAGLIALLLARIAS